MSKAPSTTPTEMLLLESSASSQDLEEFRKLYERFQPYVRKVLFWMVGSSYVDDLTQDVFLKVWRHLSKFRNDSSTKTWIHRIAINSAVDHIRKHKTKLEEFDDLNWGQESSLDHTLDMQRLIYKGLHQMSEKHQVVFVLFYKQNLSVAEISKILRISQGTVKSRLHHARENFISHLKRNGVSDEL